MRETRKSNHRSQQQSLNDKKLDALQQVVEQEYIKLYRQTHKVVTKTARNLLRHVARPPPPSPLILPIPSSIIEDDCNDDDKGDDHIRSISVNIFDGTNQKSEKTSVTATIMPALSSVRELISYVPTMRNLATRGDLTGIPYLGDTFDREDQQLINSISGETNKSNKHLTRKKKLDEQSLEILYQSIRQDQTWKTYTNAQIIDAILHYHRDSSAHSKLVAFANQTDLSLNNSSQSHVNIDTCDTIDKDIDELVVKSWCNRFCPRCYTYNCLLHKDTFSHLPLAKQFVLSTNDQTSPCSSTCYKHEREHSKRSLSPSYIDEDEQNYLSMEHVKKRSRKSTSPNRLILSPDENLLINLALPFLDTQKKHLLSRIENHMNTSYTNSLPSPSIHLADNWTLTDRSLFRLFYILFDGDLCLIQHLFHHSRTCENIYQQLVIDTKYFSDRISSSKGSPCIIRQPYRRRMIEGATRAFLFHIKKLMNNQNNSKSARLKPAYQACLHDGPCTLTNKDCFCMKNGTYCEKFCNCSIDCPHRFPGCACKGACLLNNCLCCAEGRECDPDLCHKCGASTFVNLINEDFQPMMIKTEISTTMIERKSLPSSTKRTIRSKINENLPTRQHSLRSCRTIETSYKPVRSRTRTSNPSTSSSSTSSPMITCANIGLQRKLYKQVLVAESDVAGYGAFLGSSIAYPGDLIAEYTGEIISEDEADRRGRLYDKQACSYLFNLDTKRCVDARQFGSKIRFANHSSKPNCVPKVKLVNGDYRIGIYAKQVIFQGDELFFEYMYDAHQRQQFVNNERVDTLEQNGLTILKRYGDNFILVRPTYD